MRERRAVCAPEPRPIRGKIHDSEQVPWRCRLEPACSVFLAYPAKPDATSCYSLCKGESRCSRVTLQEGERESDQMEQKTRMWEMSAGEVRARIREGEHVGPTSGMARGYVQANLVILPSDYAFDFLKFCVRNLKSCPVLEVTDTGSPEPSVVAPGADLRTDVSRYRVYEDGQLVDEPTDIPSYWRDDLVSFLLGCSFTFETALLAAGLRMAHIDQGRNVPMYITNRDCVPSGPFAGPMVVSMRPFRAEEVPLAVTISARYPMMHGAPLHIGSPEALGVSDLQNPDFGDPVSIAEDQVPVFWACGVTPQAAAKQAKPSLMITHSPGHMFVTDHLDAQYEV